MPLHLREIRVPLPAADAFEPRAGWSPVDPLPGVRFDRSFVSGSRYPDFVRLAYYRDDATSHIVAPIWFGEGAEGPPGHAHGGSLAAVLDEIMGVAAWNAGHQVVLARLATENRAMVPLGEVWLVEAWIERVEGRKVHTKAHIVGRDAAPFVSSEGLFVTIGLDSFRALYAASRDPQEL